MKKCLSRILIVVEMLSMFALSACSLLPCPYTKEEVMDYVDDLCPSEECTYEVKKTKSVEGYPEHIYTFTSEERDLEFLVSTGSALQNIDGARIPFTWYSYISDTYLYQIRKYYVDDYKDLFDTYKYDVDMQFHRSVSNDEYMAGVTFHVFFYDELETIAAFCEDLSEVYSAEHKYNSWEWMDEHPLFNIKLCSGFSENYSQFVEVGINGHDTYEDYYKALSDAYIQAVYDDKIKDESITDFTGFHKTELQITVAGEIPEKNELNYNNVNMWNPEAFVAKYDYETAQYYMPITIEIDKTCSPNFLEFYVDNADGNIINHSKNYTEFTIGSKTYEINISRGDNNYIDNFDFVKNDKILKIDSLEKTYDGQYVFWISVEDLADIFDFDYDISEEDNIIDLDF